MGQDERRGGRGRERGPEWRGDEGFGGGWGNQVPRPHRLGDRAYRRTGGDPDYDPRYGEGGGWYGSDAAADGNYLYGGPVLDAEFGGPHFERADVGSAGGRAGRRGAIPMLGSAARDFVLSGESVRDPHYALWRQRRMAEFDRDYEDYARENQSRFDREFGEWRQRRGEQRAALGRVKELWR